MMDYFLMLFFLAFEENTMHSFGRLGRVSIELVTFIILDSCSESQRITAGEQPVQLR